jgi:hypothetical protein
VPTRVTAVRVYLEVAPKRAFACAADWPGWCRSGRTPEAAVEAFTAYRPRYALVAARAGQRVSTGAVEVVEEVTGNATTEFGAPGVVPPGDGDPWRRGELRRHLALLGAAWSALDDAVRAAPAVLRKGPRGGGRDRDAIYAHVVEAEDAYARKIGVRVTAAPADRAAVDARRAAIVDALEGGDGAAWKWPARYVIRRAAWHAIDHAWEIEDRH